VHESMRLYPPAWLIPRESKDDDEMGGFRIVRGATILLCPYVTHRHPAFWENPEAFEPDRFLPERAHGRHRYAYFPFGGGPRMCMGVEMAMMEVVLILVMIVARYRVDLAAWHREAEELSVQWTFTASRTCAVGSGGRRARRSRAVPKTACCWCDR
jgi:cytochrome P450